MQRAKAGVLPDWEKRMVRPESPDHPCIAFVAVSGNNGRKASLLTPSIKNFYLGLLLLFPLQAGGRNESPPQPPHTAEGPGLGEGIDAAGGSFPNAPVRGKETQLIPSIRTVG
jgi:hypothetical protein